MSAADAAILAGFKARAPEKYDHWDLGLDKTEPWGVSVGANAAVPTGSPERGNGYGVALAWTALTPNRISGWISVAIWPSLVNSSGNIIISTDPEHLISTIGLSEMIIVHTKDATLVCPKQESQRVKDLVGRVKEKYGELRFYVDVSNDRQSAMIDFAEALSLRTCETCGAPGNLGESKTGWLATRCEAHRDPGK